MTRLPFKNAAVIGAGIVGAAAAHFLDAAGLNVTVFDAVGPASGATGASDGAVSVASKRPGALMSMAQLAREFYAKLARDGLFADLYHRRSTFLVARTGLEAELVHRHGIDLAQAGETVRDIDGFQLARRIPGLGARVMTGLEVPNDGHALGYQITARLLSKGDVTVRRHAPVSEIIVRDGRAIGVAVGSEVTSADLVIIAAGLGSAELVGLGKFLHPRKGQMIVTDRASPGRPAIDGHLMAASYLAAKKSIDPGSRNIGLVIDPLVTGQFLIGGSREDGISDGATDASTVSAILRDALDLYPPLSAQRVVRTFAGVRTATTDGLPVVGRHPWLDRVVVATGFEGDGICLGPFMGANAARLALDLEPLADIAMLSPARFAAAGRLQ